MLPKAITKPIRHYLIGTKQEFVFRKVDKIDLPPVKEIGLYIHIPFCKDMCPYCPYNRIKYDKKMVKPYLNAILTEIELYYKRLGRIEIPSVYIGGGTPTNLIDELGVILESIRDKFIVSGDICIETTPSDISKDVVKKMKEYDITMISLGVQSFNDKYLQSIGRKYTASDIYPTIDLILSSNFKSVNLDLMFVLPGEKLEDLVYDLQKAIDSGANQITAYPLFTFPYSTVGKYLKLKNLKMPNIILRRKMYKTIHDCCLENGFNRVSVWGFKKGDVPRYSSVTRDNYIGFGAGAGSFIPGVFYLNTFSVDEYIKVLNRKELPIAIKMDIDNSFSKYYWLYWRLYDTYIPKDQLCKLFDKGDKKLQQLLHLGKLLGLYNEDEKQIYLTERGSFWIHLMQNYFFLDYIDKVWTVAMKEPWPEEITI